MTTTIRPASRTETLRQLEHEVGVVIRRVRRVIGERAHAVHSDLQPASYLVLTHLAESGPSRASATAELLGIDKGAISRHVRHLVELGLLERSPDPDDGRASLLAATGAARRRLGDVQRRRRTRFDARLGDWSDADLTAFVESLGRYNDSLE